MRLLTVSRNTTSILLDLLVIPFLLVSLQSARAATLWGKGDIGLFTLDTNTGSITTIGNPQGFSPRGLAFDRSGDLYALGFIIGSDTCDFLMCLSRVDPTDGSLTIVGSTNLAISFESFEIVGDRAYASGAASGVEPGLYEISLSDGSASFIGPHGGAVDASAAGLAYDGSNLFGSRSTFLGDEDLVLLNTETGAIDEIIGAFGLNDPINLAYAEGRFWIFTPETAGTQLSSLYSLDPSDGTPTLVYSNLEVGGVAALTTLVQAVPAPGISATKEDLLLVDTDGDGRADPGDTLRYSVVISNAGASDAEGSALLDTPDLNSSLVVGSVTTTQGTVLTGNGPSDPSVEVDIGTLSQGGGSAQITFDVLVNDPFPPGILMIANQGEVSGSNFDPVLTDDPATPAFPDPTMTEVANTELDICERDLEDALQELDQCLNDPPFLDQDDDGEHDSTDQCPNTPQGEAVDGNGCSQAQFCALVDASTPQGRRECRASDWRNDQPLARPGPGDCEEQGGLCVTAAP